jgi:hypothetical protein
MSVQTEEAVESSAGDVVSPTHDEIAARAYEIHLSDEGGDELENWLRAEREVMAAQGYSASEIDDS